jgi:CheY-like chemotaxis protein
MMMPVMNGWQFLDEQRGDPALAAIPTVIISAYGEIAKSVRPSQYLAKPLQLDSVLDTIKRYCPAV